MTNPVSRMGLDHPAQGTTGDAALYTRVEALYKAIGNAMPARWLSVASLANAATSAQVHGLRVPFSQLRFVAYTCANSLEDGTGELTPLAPGKVTFAATSGSATTSVDITNASGGTLTNLRVLALQWLEDRLEDLIVDPTATAGGQVFATLAAAIAAATAGQTIRVKGAETVTTLITQSVADLTIVWDPGAKTIQGDSLPSLMNVTGARTRLVAPSIRVDTTSATYPLKIAAADCRVTDALLEVNAAATVTAAVQINSGGDRAIVDMGIKVTAGSVTIDFEDNVGTLRGRFAR